MISIGKITGCHGIKGDLKIFPYRNDVESYLDLNEIFINEQPFQITSIRTHKRVLYIHFKNVNTRDKAEKLIGKEIQILKNPEELEKDEFYLEDIIGLNIYNSKNELIGVLKDVLQTSGEVDNFQIKTPEKEILVPALKEIFKISNKKIMADIPEDYFNL